MTAKSAENLRSRCEPMIQLISGYTEMPEIAFIIKSCRLKPYQYIFHNHNAKTYVQRQWFDEFGNVLHIGKKKNLGSSSVEDKKVVHIIYNDLLIDINKINNTDLFCGLSIEKIARISRKVYLYAGVDEDQMQEAGLVSFLGLDNYWRCFLYWLGEWQMVSPLLMGLEHLKWIYQNLNETETLEFRHRGQEKSLPLPCASGGAWLSCLPAERDLLTLLESRASWILPFLKETVKEKISE